MADPKQEISILTDGTSVGSSIQKFPFQQNLYKNQAGQWETRDGFGVIAEMVSSVTSVPYYAAFGELRRADTEVQDVGLQKILGSYLMRTSFGHDQIVSVFYCVGNLAGDPGSSTTQASFINNSYVPYYSVLIYDLTTDNHYEQILYTHVSENTNQYKYTETKQEDISFQHGYYEVRAAKDISSNTIKVAEENTFWFTEFQDRLYFGSASSPTYVYEPAIIRQPRGKFLKNILLNTEINDQESNPYSEESLVYPLALKDGAFADGYTYIQQAQLPVFADASYISNRMIYAAGKTLYFSDPNNPNAIIGEESYTLDLEDNITAIEVWNNNIIVWTSFETAIYQPSLNSTFLSAGQAVLVSHKVGCLTPSCKATNDNGVFWFDEKGVYFSNNGFNITEVSKAIAPFFVDQAINPMMYYFNQNGTMAQIPYQSPIYSYVFRGNTDGAHLIFDQKFGQLVFTIPKLNISWVYKDGWYLWNYESITQQVPFGIGINTRPEVAARKNLDMPRLITRDEFIYIIGGKKTFDVYQPYEYEGIQYHYAERNNSFVLCRWKRGGALDRSTIGGYLEDWRYTSGYVPIGNSGGTRANRIFFDKMIPKRGTYTNYQTNITNPADKITFGPDQRVWLLPIRFTMNDAAYGLGNNIWSTYKLSFKYDYNLWEVVKDANDNIPAIVPTERAYTSQGYGIMNPGVGRRVQEVLTGQVDIEFSAVGNVTNPIFNPGICLQQNNKNNIIYIPFKYRTDNPVSPVPQYTNQIVYGIEEFEAYLFGSGTPETEYQSFAWSNGYIKYVTENEEAQAVDWVYKSNQIGIDDVNQIKSRGTYSQLVSRGTSTDSITPNRSTFPYGLYNSMVGSDYKDIVTQIIDVDNTSQLTLVNPAIDGELPQADNIDLVTQKDTIRSRTFTSTAGLQDRTFDNNLTYGDATVAATGNYLLDAQQMDTVAISDSVRGEQINYTLFGYLRNKAEKLIFNNIKAVVFPVGGRRRRGR